MPCHAGTPDCDAEGFNAVRYEIRAAYITEVDGRCVLHASFRDGELYHSFIEKEALIAQPRRRLKLSEYGWKSDVEAEVGHSITSGYILTAFGWQGTAGCKLAIMQELEAEVVCPFCRDGIREAETNEEGQTC